jgi:hypothetical protein
MDFHPQINGQILGPHVNVSGLPAIDVVYAGGDDVDIIPASDPVDGRDPFDFSVEVTQPVGSVQLDDGTVFTDETVAARNRVINDVSLLPAGSVVVNDALYIGSTVPFDGVEFTIDTPGVGTWVLTWEYWNGAWITIPNVIDDTVAFTTFGKNIVSFPIPAGWITTTVNTVGPQYYIRARVTTGDAAPTTDPLGSHITIANDEAVTLYAVGFTGDH